MIEFVIPRLRPASSPHDPSVSHFVEVGPDDQPKWDDQGLATALCGADVTAVEKRPLWKASGEPCRHCSRRFDEMKAQEKTP